MIPLTRAFVVVYVLAVASVIECAKEGGDSNKKRVGVVKEPAPGASDVRSPIVSSYSRSKSGLDRAFLKAVKDNDAHGVNFLLRSGANSSIRIETGSTALHLACERGFIKIVKILIKTEPRLVNLANQEGVTALHAAALHSHVKLVQMLVDYGAELNSHDAYGSTPLHCSAFNDETLLARFLISRGADPTVRDKHNSTALHIAGYAGNKHMITTLVNEGTPVDAQDKDGVAALHVASYNGHGGTVRELLLMGAEADLADAADKKAKDYWCGCKEDPTLVCDPICLPDKG